MKLLKTTLLLLTAMIMIETTSATQSYTRSRYYNSFGYGYYYSDINRVKPRSYTDYSNMLSNYKPFDDKDAKSKANYINYQEAKSKARDYNKYMKITKGQGAVTYEPLHVYFRPGYNIDKSDQQLPTYAYWSPVYLMRYYDGYGFNFYTRKYNYYQNSPNDAQNRSSNSGTVFTFLAIAFGILTILSVFIIKVKMTVGERPYRAPSLDPVIEKAVEQEYELYAQKEDETYGQEPQENQVYMMGNQTPYEAVPVPAPTYDPYQVDPGAQNVTGMTMQQTTTTTYIQQNQFVQNPYGQAQGFGGPQMGGYGQPGYGMQQPPPWEMGYNQPGYGQQPQMGGGYGQPQGGGPGMMNPQGMNPYSQTPQGMNQGANPYSQAPQGMSQGANPYSQAPQGMEPQAINPQVQAFQSNPAVAYKQACDTLNPCDPARLTLALECVNFYHDILNDTKKAREVAESAMSDSLGAIDNVDEATFKLAKELIEHLKQKLSQWDEED